jgi:hypothetical protein
MDRATEMEWPTTPGLKVGYSYDVTTSKMRGHSSGSTTPTTAFQPSFRNSQAIRCTIKFPTRQAQDVSLNWIPADAAVQGQ